MKNEKPIRALVLVTDAYGGRGGIALYNRNLINALSQYPGMEEIVVIPRIISYALEDIPDNVTYKVDASRGSVYFMLTCIKQAISLKKFDIIICSHLHLLPIAWFLSKRFRCPVLPVIYGIEAWTPTSHKFANYLCGGLHSFITIRPMTARRLIDWAKISHQNYYYLPNCIDIKRYGIGVPRDDLLEKYALRGKTVVMTSGRLDGGNDIEKGFDEIIEVLPELRKKIDSLVYLIMGDGDDRRRLEYKASKLGVDDIVIFTGYTPEDEKADYYRLAHVFAMPGRNHLFDRYPYRFVFLEALACGVPVVGSKLEDPWDLDDPNTKLIIQVDPAKKESIIEGIMKGLSLGKAQLQPELSNFYCEVFTKKLHEIINDVIL